jgi:hypothetical protein
MAKQRKSVMKYASTREAAVREAEQGSWTPTSYRIPSGMEQFKFEEAKRYRLNVLPHVVGKNNPGADEGTLYYKHTFLVHQNLGPEGRDSYACLKTFKKKCPICEEQARMRLKGVDKDAVSALNAKTRNLFVFEDLDDKGKYKVYEASYFRGFGELLQELMDNMEDDEGGLKFFHLDEGMTLKVRAKEDTFNGKTF